MISLFVVIPLALGAAASSPDEASSSDGGVALTTPLVVVPDGGTQVQMLIPQKISVYHVDLAGEAAITAGALALYVMVDLLIKPTLSAGPTCRHTLANGQCDPADLSPFDRYAVGKSSKGWSIFADVALASALVAPVIFLALESLTLPTREPLGDFVNDALVVTESLALTAAAGTLLKFSFRRPRPDNYLPPEAGGSIDVQLSTPSGHTTMVAAATTALTTTLFMRHPHAKWRWVVLAGGVTLSVLTALARVESGDHFPTDALLGLFIGGAAGLAVPWMHRIKPLGLTPSVAFNPATGTSTVTVGGSL